MNRKQVTEKLLRNWPAKIICLAIAIFLYIFYQASLIEKKTFVIPLNVIESGLVVHTGSIPTSVVVSVRASENDIKSIFATDMSASINLNNYIESGTYRVPVEVSIDDKLKGFDPLEIKLKEEKLKINVEKRVSKYVKVMPSVVGDVDKDYEIKNVIMSPSAIRIEGPESLVNAVSEVYTGKVNVSNAKTNFTTDTTFNPINNLIRIVDAYTCKATVLVVPKVEEREYVSVPLKVVNLSDKLQLGEDLPKYSIKLKGEVPNFTKYDISKNPIIIDLAEIKEPGIYEIPVEFTIPYDFELLDDSGESITVTVVDKDIVAEKDEESLTDDEEKDVENNGDKDEKSSSSEKSEDKKKK